MKPSSFSTIATKSCAHELIGLLLSLSVFHPGTIIYVMADTATQKEIQSMTPKVKVDIKWFIELDNYSSLNRKKMEDLGIFRDFLKSKARIMMYALDSNKDVLFLDSDIILTDKITCIEGNKKLGVSRQYIRESECKTTGEYNAGMIWTKSKNVCQDWIKYTDTSRYFEQAAIEDLVVKYKNSYFLFGEEHNIQCWRYYLNPEPEPFQTKIKLSESGQVLYKNRRIASIHTHFRDPRFNEFNKLMIDNFSKAKQYKIILIIYRLLNGVWLLRIPKNQHMDSFRELAMEIGKRINDVLLIKTKDKHCWLSKDIMLYDRPTLEWMDNEASTASLILMGNGDVKKDAIQITKKTRTPALPWIFWPRHPAMLENYILKNTFIENRPITSIFIGNIENNIQNHFRQPFINEWSKVVEVFRCVYGQKHVLSQTEYLHHMANSKYGLCIRGYGVKCHREMELMALGTVPIVTNDVNTSSFMEPLIKNTHFLFASTPEEFKKVIENTSDHKWKEMSNNCIAWYKRNINSLYAWETMISRILF